MMNYFHRFIRKSQRLRDLRRSREALLIMNKKGQAMIEYLLMVVMMVVLLAGLMITFFVPLGDFISSLNNSYIRCLLETGELPKVGVEGTAMCDEFMPRFQGRNMDGSPSSPRGTTRNSENERGQSSSADGSTGSEAGGVGSLSAMNRKSSMIRNGMRSNGNARSESSGSKSTNIPVEDFNAGEGFASNGSSAFIRGSKKKTKKIDLSGLTEYDRKKIEKEQTKNRAIAVDSETFTQKRNKKLIVKPPPEKKLDDDLNVQTDFSRYFKIFFFIIIILFIIILMASQAMQMTNSSDN